MFFQKEAEIGSRICIWDPPHLPFMGEIHSMNYREPNQRMSGLCYWDDISWPLGYQVLAVFCCCSLLYRLCLWDQNDCDVMSNKSWVSNPR